MSGPRVSLGHFFYIKEQTNWHYFGLITKINFRYEKDYNVAVCYFFSCALYAQKILLLR